MAYRSYGYNSGLDSNSSASSDYSRRVGQLFIIGCILFLVVFVAIMFLGFKTVSTSGREPLDKQYVTESGDWILDETGMIQSDSTVIDSMKYFYDKTGVAPYLVVIKDIGGNLHPTQEQISEYAASIYKTLFTDEGHLVFMVQYIDNNSDYMMAAVPGKMAETVMDDEALETLYACMRFNLKSDKTADDIFAETFRLAADEIMGNTGNSLDGKAIIAVVLFVLLMLVIVVLVIKQNSKSNKESIAEIERISGVKMDKLFDSSRRHR